MTGPVFCASARKECYADGNSATKALFFCPRLSLRNPRPGASRFFKLGKTLLFSPQDVQTSNLMLLKIISRDGCRPRRLGFRNQTSIWPSTSSTAWCSLRRSAWIADGSAICSATAFISRLGRSQFPGCETRSVPQRSAVDDAFSGVSADHPSDPKDVFCSLFLG